MKKPQFIPTLFISIGATGAMFTLRETYLHERYARGDGSMGGAMVNGAYQGTVEYDIWSKHLKNLGQNPDDSYIKASAYAAETGLELTTTREHLQEELRKIHRSSPEEIEAARVAFAYRYNGPVHDEYDAKIMRNMAEAGSVWCMPFGSHKGKDLRVLAADPFTRPYVEWVSNELENEMYRCMAELVLEKTTIVDSNHVGNIKERIEKQLYVAGERTFTRAAWNGYGEEAVSVYTLKDEDGNIYVIFTPTLSLEVGSDVLLRGTVKEHGEYKGVKQTILNRPKVMEQLS